MMKGSKLFLLINSVTRDKRLKHSDVRIFNCLISFNGFNKIFPSQQTISNLTGIKSIPDISKALGKLCKLGYIFIDRRKHKTNIYRLNFNWDNVNSNSIKVKLPDENSCVYCCKYIYNKILEQNVHFEQNNSLIINLVRSKNNSILQNTYVLMYLLNIVKNKSDRIGNVNGYLTSSFKNTDYEVIHKSIYNKSKNSIKYDKTKRNNFKSIGQNRNVEYSRSNIY